VGLSALPFDEGEGYHPTLEQEDAPPAAKRSRESSDRSVLPCSPWGFNV
jgi:hypothetical protein